MGYVLHYAPDNASLIVRIALEELGAAYETRLVDRRARAQDGAAYRALNPAGTIPVLETPDGALAETGAILLWLADRHGKMAPAPSDAGRGRFLQQLFFLSNTVQAMMRMRFYPERHVGADPAAQAALDRQLTTPDPLTMTLPHAFALLDRWVADFGPEPDMRDPYIGCLTRWAQLYPKGKTGWFDLTGHPALLARLAKLETRPAILRAAPIEGLGPTVFTAPRHATPLAGSAT